MAFILGLSKWPPGRNFIFHVKSYQLTRDRKRPLKMKTFLETLYKQGFKVIYIRRINTIKHCLSNLVAKQRGRFHKFDDAREDINVTINCKRFANRVKERLQFYNEEMQALHAVEYCEVVYEDDLEKSSRHQKAVDRILDYLNLERRTAATRHRKVNTMPIKKLISNFDEFANRMKEHGWHNFLDP